MGFESFKPEIKRVPEETPKLQVVEVTPELDVGKKMPIDLAIGPSVDTFLEKQKKIDEERKRNTPPEAQ